MVRTIPNPTDLYSAVPAPVAGVSMPPLRYGLGELYLDDDEINAYRFVKNSGLSGAGTALNVGQVCWWAGDTGKIASNVCATEALSGGPAGVALSAIPLGGWGFIQTRGRCGPVPATSQPGQAVGSVFPGCTAGTAIPLGTAAAADRTAGSGMGKFIPAVAGSVPIATTDVGTGATANPGQILRLMFD